MNFNYLVFKVTSLTVFHILFGVISYCQKLESFLFNWKFKKATIKENLSNLHPFKWHPSKYIERSWNSESGQHYHFFHQLQVIIIYTKN